MNPWLALSACDETGLHHHVHGMLHVDDGKLLLLATAEGGHLDLWALRLMMVKVDSSKNITISLSFSIWDLHLSQKANLFLTILAAHRDGSHNHLLQMS